MSSIFSTLNKQQFTSNLLISSLVIALPLGFNLSALAQKVTSPEPVLSPSTDVSTDSVIQKLIGTWRVQNSPISTQLDLVFTPAGKVYLVFNYGQKLEAYQVEYRINTKTKPSQIDMISQNGKEKIATIFEFTNQGNLRLEFIGLDFGNIRPKDFTPNASLFKKVSDSTKLAANVKVITDEDRENRKRQRDGEINVRTMNRYQQAYYTEYGKFAKNVQELQINFKLESEFYNYRIIPQGNQAVMQTATAKKPGLKSYTGFVYTIKVKKEINTYAIICETNQPSMKPPAAPKIPRNTSQKAQCPVGSSLLP
jgi:hypothetical protein